jgi:hypothetical protein
MEALPLSVLIGPKEELVLFNDEIVAGLTFFELDASDRIRTTFTCTNCFPRPSGHRVREIGKYPLRIRTGDDIDHAMVTYVGRPISGVRKVFVCLNAAVKRTVRVTTYTKLPDKLNTALLDLGVEVIVQSPDADQALGDVDANL